MPHEWRRVDLRLDRDAGRLARTDSCFYYYDHVPGGYSMSRANQLMFNLKKPMDRRGMPDWHYKAEAIDEFSRDLAAFVDSLGFREARVSAILAAMPPSKCRDSEEYDDRIVQVVEKASRLSRTDWADPFDVLQDMQPAHLGGTRDECILASNMGLNLDARKIPQHGICILVDDMFTSGAHYVACRRTMENAFPDVRIIGAFWAKRLLEPREHAEGPF